MEMEIIDRVETLSKSNINKRAIEHYMDIDRYNSLHIEGNTLTLIEISEFIDKGVKVKDKPFKDYMQLTNYNNALIWIKQKKR